MVVTNFTFNNIGIMGQYIDILLKLIISLSILNVWLLRANKPSKYRGGKAATIKEEFASYGLSETAMKAVGIIKCGLALLLLVSIIVQEVELIAAAGICIMMLGAIVMHYKVKDAPEKSMPAALFFILTLITLFI